MIEFLKARLDSDEAYARNAFRPHGDEGPKNGPEWREIWSGTVECGRGGEHIATFDSQLSRHIERHDPARVLREVEAKRKIVEAASITLDIYTGFSPFMDFITETLRRLAVAWEDHPDYDQSWRPFGEAYREEWRP
jgi:hypothetical protein